MNRLDTIAERFNSLQGLSVADCIEVALPVYSVQADVLCIDRRELLPTEEYVLRAIEAGISAPGEIFGLLGFLPMYGHQLVESLVEDDFVGRSDSGDLVLRKKGSEAIADGGEDVLTERSLQILWDPISRRVFTARIELLAPRAIKSSGRLKVVPKSLKLPLPSEISIGDIQSLLAAGRETIDTKALKCIELRRPYLRYRDGVLLAYAGEKSTPPAVRVATDGLIDDEFSASLAASANLELLGIDKGFFRRGGTQAVEQRLRRLPGPRTGASTYGEKLRRRSALRFGIDSLEKKPSPDESDLAKLAERRREFDAIEEELAAFPQRSLQAYEIGYLVDGLISGSRHSLLITSTLPVSAKCGRMTLHLLEKALERGVAVFIYLVGRPPADFMTSRDEQLDALRHLSELANQYDNLRVAFLRDSNRVVFECMADEQRLLVANEPAFGMRPSPALARQFSGAVLSGAEAVKSYLLEFLSTLDAATSEHFRFERGSVRRRGGRRK